jgi:hypothetical protein
MQSVLNLIWDKFLPACAPRKLRSNRAAQAQLGGALAGLQMSPAQGAETSELAAKVLNRRFVFPSNDQKLESVSLNSTDGGKGLTLVVRLDGKEMNLPAGCRQWQKGRAPFAAGRLAQFPDEPVAGTFAWPARDSAEIKVCAYETPFVMTFRLKFDGDQVTLDRETNVAFGARKHATLVGRTEKPNSNAPGASGGRAPSAQRLLSFQKRGVGIVEAAVERVRGEVAQVHLVQLPQRSNE